MPSFSARFDKTCTAYGEWGVSATGSLWDTPMQCEARQRQKTVPALVTARSYWPISTKYLLKVAHDEIGYVWRFCHPAAMQGKIGIKNFISLQGKVALVTAQFRPNLLCLWRVGTLCHLWCLSQSAAIRGMKVTKAVSVSRVKFPWLLPDTHRTCSVTGAWVRLPRMVSESSSCNVIREKDQSCFDLRSEVPFINVRFRPNL
jgi:hypothetical protein